MQAETTEQLREKLFDCDDRRRGFVASCIVRDASSELLGLMEKAVGVSAIGPFRLFWATHSDPRTPLSAIATFIPAKDFETNREFALNWIQTVSARDVLAVVVIYTLTPDQTDFATLERLVPDWLPDTIKPGDILRYQGIAYPSRGATGVDVTVLSEGFAIEEIISDENDLWYCIRNLAAENETLWLTHTLLLGGSKFETPERLQPELG